jgi:hypothetical protein
MTCGMKQGGDVEDVEGMASLVIRPAHHHSSNGSEPGRTKARSREAVFSFHGFIEFPLCGYPTPWADTCGFMIET